MGSEMCIRDRNWTFPLDIPLAHSPGHSLLDIPHVDIPTWTFPSRHSPVDIPPWTFPTWTFPLGHSPQGLSLGYSPWTFPLDIAHLDILPGHSNGHSNGHSPPGHSPWTFPWTFLLDISPPGHSSGYEYLNVKALLTRLLSLTLFLTLNLTPILTLN